MDHRLTPRPGSIQIVMSNGRDIHFMQLAIQQAVNGQQSPGGAEVGAVLVKDGAVRCAGFNESEMRHDPTAHAEIVVMRRLCAELQTNSLEGFTLYCTLQPCGMCTMACLWAGISRIVYGAGRDDVHAVYFESRHNNTFDFIRDAFRDDLEIEGGVLAEECAAFYAGPHQSVPQQDDPAHGRTEPPR
jgi:tRNA(adenine34) deaminase